MKRTFAALIAALAFAGAASAETPATLSDISALGYVVSASSQCDSGNGLYDKIVWNIAGYGISLSASECDPGFQAELDSIVAGHCNRKWQFLFPEQVDPWSAIARLGWTETAAQCSDIFTVTNPNDQTVRYSGPGAGLVALAAVIDAPPVPVPVVVPPPVVTPAPVAAPAPPPPPVDPPAAPQAPEPSPPVPVAVAVLAVPTITLTADDLARIVSDAITSALRQMLPIASPAARPRPATPASSRRKAPKIRPARQRSSRPPTAAAAPTRQPPRASQVPRRRR